MRWYMILLPKEMFQDDNDINCYNLFVNTEFGEQMWDVDIFKDKHPKLYRMVEKNFKNNVLSFDYKNINFTLG